MFVAEISVSLAPEADPDELYSLLGSLRRNGQVLGNDSPIVQSGQQLKCYVHLPKSDALHRKHDDKWVKQSKISLIEKGLTRLKHKVLGEDPTHRTADKCQEPSNYILFTHYLTIESPLRCGDCFDPVPLYLVPPTDGGREHCNLGTWEADYKACDTLQMNCSTGERFGIREMSDADSSLSRRGRQHCQEIEARTGKPAYYYLFRAVKQTTTEREEARLCPVCGGPWLLEEPWHLFNFRCETCRLVSNISWGTY